MLTCSERILFGELIEIHLIRKRPASVQVFIGFVTYFLQKFVFCFQFSGFLFLLTVGAISWCLDFCGYCLIRCTIMGISVLLCVIFDTNAAALAW